MVSKWVLHMPWIHRIEHSHSTRDHLIIVQAIIHKSNKQCWFLLYGWRPATELIIGATHPSRCTKARIARGRGIVLPTQHWFHIKYDHGHPHRSWSYKTISRWFMVSGLKFPTLNSSPTGRNDHHFADDIFKCIFVNETFCILIKISPKVAPKGSIDSNTDLV